MRIVVPMLKATYVLGKVAVKATWHTAVGVSAATCWSVHGISKGVGLVADLSRASASTDDGELICENGHVVATDGIFECTSCHYVWNGLVWACPNPECGARTPFVFCETCGLSVRNPHRLVA